jgi:hypothetical protein
VGLPITDSFSSRIRRHCIYSEGPKLFLAGSFLTISFDTFSKRSVNKIYIFSRKEVLLKVLENIVVRNKILKRLNRFF